MWRVVAPGLWQRDARRSTWQPARQTTVCDECRWTTCLLCAEVRAHHPATPWPSLSAGARVDSLNSVLDFWCLASELRRVADVDTRKRLRSSSTSALVTPSSCRTTTGDRAFFVTAPRAWNTLPSSITASETLGTFRRRLKMHLFATSLNFSKLRTLDFVLFFDFEKCSWSNL